MPFPIDPKYISETETKLSTTFPSTFRGKMMRDNGGSVEVADDEWLLYPFFDQSDRKRVARTCNDIVQETGKMREWSNFPACAVAIGGNGTGDQLILVAKTDKPDELGPAVYWWDHETGDVQKVADDFAELL
jgi:SMI1 / KNR4 family (SUKH-1)